MSGKANLIHETTGSYLVVVSYDLNIEAVSDKQGELLGDIVLLMHSPIDLQQLQKVLSSKKSL